MELFYVENLSRRKIGDPNTNEETYDLIYYYLKEIGYRPFRIQTYTSPDLTVNYYDFGTKNARFVRINN